MVFVASAGGAAALIAGGSIISGGLGYLASQQASSAQVGAEQQALQAQNQARSKLNPFINIGTGATNTLGGLYGIGANGKPTTAPIDYSQFYNSPDYKFALQQGQQGLQAYENASGLAASGSGLAAAAQFNQGLATQQYGNYFNRLMQLSQVGSNAAQAGVGGANAAGQTIGNIGQSQASGIIGGANAVTGSINSGISNSLLYNAINRGGNPSGFVPSGTPASPFQFPNAPFSGGQ